MEQIAKVRTGEIDADETGREWACHYVLYRSETDDGLTCFDLYEDDGAGNGAMICRGDNERVMRSLILRLGELVEWKAGVPLIRSAA